MKVQNLIEAGFKPLDAMKGAERYKELIGFMEANGMEITEVAGMLLDLQYYKMTNAEWKEQMEIREMEADGE